MNAYTLIHVKNMLSLLFIVTFFLLLACKNEDGSFQKIVINLNETVEISDGKLSQKTTTKSSSQLERLNSIANSNQAFFSATFSKTEKSLNEQGELDTYINLVFLNEISITKINNIIEELERLEMVETAYQAPIGEDAGMSLPEN